jgi:hypothetical protein
LIATNQNDLSVSIFNMEKKDEQISMD